MMPNPGGAGVRRTVASGSIAGWVGGLAFGAAMLELGVLPTVASLVRTDSALIGGVVHMLIAAVVGAALALLLRGRWAPGDLLFWGVAYGASFWFIGPLTLQPIILGRLPAWDISAAQAALPSLVGHVVWGTTTGIALGGLQAITERAARRRDVGGLTPGEDRSVGPIGVLARGVAAGLVATWAINLVPGSFDRIAGAIDEPGTGGFAPLALALASAVAYAALHPRSTTTAGGAVVRGAGFGFVLWVIGGLTILPVLRGDGLQWSIADVRAAFAGLPGSILFASVMAVTYHGLGRLGQLLFSESGAPRSPDGGSWGARSIIRGAAAGLVGGFLFTIVMVQLDALPGVARLVGSSSAAMGLLVHAAIAVMVGVSYGVLFRRQAFDSAAAVGWGVSYGFVWWVLGPLTLAPIILGGAPTWDVLAATAAYPSLIGHLAFGAGLGFTAQRLEAQYSPWWISRSTREAVLMAAQRSAAMTAGPALWTLLVLIAVLLPVVLSP